MLPLAHQTPKLFYCPKSFLLVYLRANLRFNSVSVYPPIALFVWVTLLFLQTIYFYLPVTLFACDCISVSILSTYNYIYPYLILSVSVSIYLPITLFVCVSICISRLFLQYISFYRPVTVFVSDSIIVCLLFLHSIVLSITLFTLVSIFLCYPSVFTFYLHLAAIISQTPSIN